MIVTFNFVQGKKNPLFAADHEVGSDAELAYQIAVNCAFDADTDSNVKKFPWQITPGEKRCSDAETHQPINNTRGTTNSGVDSTGSRQIARQRRSAKEQRG